MKELTQQYHDRLVELFLWEKAHPELVLHDRGWKLFAYLLRRAWRPLHRALKGEYERVWGKNCTYSYFFPEHTHNEIWWRALDTFKEQT